MNIDKQKLKFLAEAATQSHGDRRVEVDHNGVHVIGDGSWKILSAWHTPDGKGAQNAEFAAASSPATVLALLAEIERLEFEPAKHARRLIDQLKAENEALRKDAERYRWIEKQPTSWFALGEAFDLPSEYEGSRSLDASIDAAMAKEIQ